MRYDMNRSYGCGDERDREAAMACYVREERSLAAGVIAANKRERREEERK